MRRGSFFSFLHFISEGPNYGDGSFFFSIFYNFARARILGIRVSSFPFVIIFLDRNSGVGSLLFCIFLYHFPNAGFLRMNVVFLPFPKDWISRGGSLLFSVFFIIS